MSSVHNPSTSSEKKVIIEDGKDRISELPDAILVHILSFLPTKSVVDKSILSPRWRNLWASVPVLDFDDRSHKESNRNVYVPLLARVSYGLMNFVDKVLLLHDFSSLSKFRLKCTGRIDMSRLNAWIIHAVKHLIQEIDVEIPSYDSFMYLPQSLCTSNTLVVLRLGYFLRIQLPTSVWFPSLKILEISFLYLENNMIQKLLCSCPTLENLTVEVILRVTEMVLNVAIPTLKRLNLKLMADEEAAQYNGYKILLDTPSLENLTLFDCFLAWYSLKNMSSLVKASVYIEQCLSFETEEHANRVHEIIRGLSTVKSLSLSDVVTDVLSAADDNNLPMFYNLIHMDMPIQIDMIWPLQLKLLKNMPNIERLELLLEYTDDCEDFNDKKFIAVESQEVPSCLLSHRKEIKVSDFNRRKDGMNLVKYLLKNAKVLEKITIDSFHHINEKEKKFRKKLLSLPKGSKTCQIKFSREILKFFLFI